MTAVLTWLGERARWGLVVSVLIAIVFPQLAALFRPILPALVAMVLGLAIARVDAGQLRANLSAPRHWLAVVAVTVVIMPVTALVLAPLAGLALGEPWILLLLIFAASPPIASSAALCFMLGLDAVLALEITLVATMLTPLFGPLIFALLSHVDVGITSLDLALRLSLMIAGGFAVGVTIRTVLGRQWIVRNGRAFDGIATIGMGIFVLPLFVGFTDTVLADPLFAAQLLGLCFMINLGTNLLTSRLATPVTGAQTGGALGVIAGNRTVAIYAAALPFDPTLTLFVALYQLPMYLTPLIWGRLGRWRAI